MFPSHSSYAMVKFCSVDGIFTNILDCFIGIFVDANADVNVINSDGSTPLHDAVARGDKEIVAELLKHGAIVNVIPFQGYGPIFRNLCVAVKTIALLFDGSYLEFFFVNVLCHIVTAYRYL